MKRKTSVFARLLAVLALAGAVVAVVLAVQAVVKEADSDSGKQRQNAQTQTQPEKEKPKPEPPETYTVESGDTLTRISAETGVPVTQIKELNPELDPQILEVGQTLKLR